MSDIKTTTDPDQCGLPTFFEYQPLQQVVVTAYGLNYDGCVMRCVLTRNNCMIYEVEYAVNGEIKRYDFIRDELNAA